MSYPYQIKSLEQYHEDYRQSVENPDGFWAKVASHFEWKRRWDSVQEWNFTDPKVEMVQRGKLNITENRLSTGI